MRGAKAAPRSRSRRVRGSVFLAALVLLLQGLSLCAEDTAWTLSGSVERMDAASMDASADLAWTATSALDLSLSVTGEGARAEAAFRVTLLNGEAALPVIAAGGGFMGGILVAPLDPSATNAAALAVELRSLQVRLDSGELRLRAGRQIVNFGRGAAFSPADVFSKRDLSGLSPERRPLDALRLSGPFGGLGGWDLVAAPAAVPADGSYAVRAFGYVLGLDGGLLAGRDGASGDWLAAADAQFDLGATFKGEGTLRISDSRAARFSAMAGLDWSFGDLLMAAEYFHNGDGASGAIVLSPTGPLDSAEYGYALVSYRVDEFLALGLSALADFGGALLAPAVSARIDLAQNALLTLALRGLAEVGAGELEAATLGATLSVAF